MSSPEPFSFTGVTRTLSAKWRWSRPAVGVTGGGILFLRGPSRGSDPESDDGGCEMESRLASGYAAPPRGVWGAGRLSTGLAGTRESVLAKFLDGWGWGRRERSRSGEGVVRPRPARDLPRDDIGLETVRLWEESSPSRL